MKKAASKAGKFIKRVGGKIVAVAKSIYNKVVNEAKAIGRKITATIAKLDLIKKLKHAVNKFFELTESCRFEKRFKATVGRFMKRYGFS